MLARRGSVTARSGIATAFTRRAISCARHMETSLVPAQIFSIEFLGFSAYASGNFAIGALVLVVMTLILASAWRNRSPS